MAFITLRQANVVVSPGGTIKGSPLTNAEVDNNFANINIVIGFREDLITTATDNLVAAVNEVRSDLDNLSSDSISNGTSNVSISTANGPIVISANLIPNVGNVINLGSDTNRFKDLFLSGNTINLGGDTISSVGGFIKINNADVFTTTGNIASANIDAGSITTGTLPVVRGGTGITSFGTGVAAFLGNPTSANFAAVVTDETGSGALVFATSPSLVTPILGTPQSGNLNNCVFPTLNQNTTGSAATLTTARTIGGVSFNGSTDINLPGVNQAGNQNTTGSAATLTTARTIGGVSFNGSTDINLPGVNTGGNQNTTGSAATLTTARTINGVSFNGGSNITVPGDIPSGTVMLFGQTTAPTGFTKNTSTGNNSALRITTGTVTTGGSVDFSTAFASQTPAGTVSVSGSVGNTTLSIPQIPSHSHTISTSSGYVGPSGTLENRFPGGTANTGSTGGGGAHNHPFSTSSATFSGNAINLAVKFVDVIQATKN